MVSGMGNPSIPATLENVLGKKISERKQLPNVCELGETLEAAGALSEIQLGGQKMGRDPWQLAERGRGRWLLSTHRQHVLSQDELRQIFTVPN